MAVAWLGIPVSCRQVRSHTLALAAQRMASALLLLVTVMAVSHPAGAQDLPTTWLVAEARFGVDEEDFERLCGGNVVSDDVAGCAEVWDLVLSGDDMTIRVPHRDLRFRRIPVTRQGARIMASGSTTGSVNRSVVAELSVRIENGTLTGSLTIQGATFALLGRPIGQGSNSAGRRQ